MYRAPILSILYGDVFSSAKDVISWFLSCPVIFSVFCWCNMITSLNQLNFWKLQKQFISSCKLNSETEDCLMLLSCAFKQMTTSTSMHWSLKKKKIKNQTAEPHTIGTGLWWWRVIFAKIIKIYLLNLERYNRADQISKEKKKKKKCRTKQGTKRKELIVLHHKGLLKNVRL